MPKINAFYANVECLDKLFGSEARYPAKMRPGRRAPQHPRPHHPVVPRMLMTCVCRPAFDVLHTTGTEVAFSSIVQCPILCPQVVIIRALHMMCHIFWSISLSWCEMFYCLWQQTTLSCHVIKFTDWKGSSAGSMWCVYCWPLMTKLENTN